MHTRTATCTWTGDYRSGQGTIIPGSESFRAECTFDSIHRGGEGSNPIEVLAASLAGCFSGALAAILSNAGHPPAKVHTEAVAHLEPAGPGFTICRIDLRTRAEVSGIDQAELRKHAEIAKQICPVGQALSVEIVVQADLA